MFCDAASGADKHMNRTGILMRRDRGLARRRFRRISMLQTTNSPCLVPLKMLPKQKPSLEAVEEEAVLLVAPPSLL